MDENTKKQIIKLLEWLPKSGYSTEGMNGWAVQGWTPYAKISTEVILKDFTKAMSCE